MTKLDRNDELLRQFGREYHEVNSITPERRTAQLRLLRKIAAGPPPFSLDALDGRRVRTFAGAELADGYHPNTVRKHLGMIRSFVAWGEQAGLLEPMRVMELRAVSNPRGSTGRSMPNPYTVAQVLQFKALLATKYPPLPEEGRHSHALLRFTQGRTPVLRTRLWRHARRLQFEAQIALALECGLRRIEIFNLTLPALHYDNDEVVVVSAKQGPGTEVTRHIPYPTHARNCVQEWLDFRFLLKPSHDSPWLQLAFGDLSMQIAGQSWRSFRDSIGRTFGQPWHWHRFRHTAATEWLRSGVPLEKVRLYMGHASIDQTLQYAEIVKSDLGEAFGKAEADFARRLGLAA